MRINVLLFGPQAELAESSSLSIEVDEKPTAGRVLEAIASASPALAPTLPASRLAVNHEYAMSSDVLSVSDEVALIGMVSGG